MDKVITFDQMMIYCCIMGCPVLIQTYKLTTCNPNWLFEREDRERKGNFVG